MLSINLFNLRWSTVFQSGVHRPKNKEMRQRLPLTTCILLFLFCKVVSAHVPSVEEILQTNQYFLVSQQDGVTSVEMDVPSGRCPQFMIKPRTNHPKSLRFSGAHLVRDPFGRSPPMLMTIREDEKSFSANIFSLNASGIFQQTSRRVFSFVDKSKRLSPKTSFAKKRKIHTTLFDTTNRMLYIDYSTPDSFEMEQYYISGLYTANFNLVTLNRYSRSSPSSRFDWQEDSYAGKFYYKERIDNQIELFEIPMNALVPTVFEGDAGLKVGRISDDGTLLGASGGVFYTSTRKQEGETTTLSNSLVPANLSAGLSCEINVTTSDQPLFNKLIVIRNNDYCMLRDGSNYNSKNCEEQHKAFLASQTAVKEQTDIVKWLLVACIVMFMVIVLLFVYIYWLRSTFISDDERTHQNEYETEASLFVTKQRSFPSVYHDPALLDVSVDKWN